MRNLATVQKIKKLEPIPNKDRIELATILGWEVIVEKGRYKAGDLVVYCEYDTVLPERPEFEFLRNRCWNNFYKGFRIKNMKMAGVFSQGIVFPLSILNGKRAYKEGDDVTDELGIVKYDSEFIQEQKSGNKPRKKHGKFVSFLLKFKFFKRLLYLRSNREPFPTHLISKTDETRVQVLQEVLQEYEGIECFVTEKLDGQSATYAYDGKTFYVCSRNFWLKKKNNSNYWKIAEFYDIKKKLKELYKKHDIIAMQGEIVGPGVQKNRYKLNDLEFYVFNLVHKNNDAFFIRSHPYFLDDLLPAVPLIKYNYSLSGDIKELVELSKGKSILKSTIPREGIVIRSNTGEPRDVGNVGHWFSFKVINPDYLIKYNL